MPDTALPDPPARIDAAQTAPTAETAPRRPLRADARRNRERVLTAAREAFATEGPSVGLDEIARRAGVGAGTVHRHFPTKEELFKAVIADRLLGLAAHAEALGGAADPGEAFFAFFHRLAAEARPNLALSAALTDGTDLADVARGDSARADSPRKNHDAVLGESILEAGQSLQRALAVLLDRAQRAGAVRADIDATDLHAIIAGALVMEQQLASPAAAGRGLAVVAAGLKA